LTNDGDFAHQLSHPSFEHEKEYQCKIRNIAMKIKNLSEIKTLFLNGLSIDGKIMKADKVIIEPNIIKFHYLTFSLVIHTGHNRQIRRMCDKIGLGVEKLIRVRVGNLKLSSLGLMPGDCKEISKGEII